MKTSHAALLAAVFIAIGLIMWEDSVVNGLAVLAFLLFLFGIVTWNYGE